MSGANEQAIDTPILPQYAQPHWYASYTCSRREKQVAKSLRERGLECFLPVYDKVHHWSHDTRKVQLPLFPGYVFVHIPLCERVRILGIPGLVRLVSFNGEPAALPDAEVETLRHAMEQGGLAEPHPYMEPGQQVQVRRGPFQGLRGTVVRSNNRLRLIVSVDLLLRSIVLNVDAADLAS